MGAVERLVDEGHLAASSQHFAHPRGPGAVSTGDQNRRREWLHVIYLAGRDAETSNTPRTVPSKARRLPRRASRTIIRRNALGAPSRRKPIQSVAEAWRRISRSQCFDLVRAYSSV